MLLLIYNDSIPAQPLKAASPIEVTPSVISTFFSPVQL